MCNFEAINSFNSPPIAVTSSYLVSWLAASSVINRKCHKVVLTIEWAGSPEESIDLGCCKT